MNMDTSCTEIEVMFKKEYTKLKPSDALRVDGSAVCGDPKYFISLSGSNTP
jgi:hypothetical protein